MGKISITLLMQLSSLLACVTAATQVKHNVVKLHAYVQETIAGNIERDSAGNEASGVDVQHLLFAETTGKYLPQWNIVYTNKGVFAVQPSEIKEGLFTPGKLKSGKAASPIRVKRGNRLWQLTLIPMKARIPAGVAELLKKNDVVVITEWNNEQFTHTIAEEIELEPVFYK
ncbi:MAG TPA: hypothetical protein VF145_00575 [Chitinophagaceae bacterium]